MTELELALRELDVEWPATPDLAAAVSARLASEPAPRRAAPRGGAGALFPRPRGWRARLAYLGATLVLLGGGTLVVSPAARTDVLRWLGLKNVEIKREPPRATPGPRSTTGSTLGLGKPVTLEQARADRDAPVLVPTALGEPEAVYATTLFDGTPAVSLVYAPRAGLPPSGVTGVALLVQTFEATVQRFIEKTIGSADRVQRLTVDGAPAFWLEGAHGFAYEAGGQVSFEEQRLADSTLLVERADGILLRIEGDIERDRAVAIARSVN